MNNTKGTNTKKKRQPTRPTRTTRPTRSQIAQRGTESTEKETAAALTVKEIVEQYLEAHGFDGLYDDDADCGCFLGDLMPCDCCWCNCQGGYAFIDSEGDRRIGGKRGG